MTVTDDPPDEKLYTAAELLETVLAAYEKGLTEGAAAAGRARWADPAVAGSFRAERIRIEITAMKERAAVRYLSRCYPEGYDYRGGPVDWESGLPAGSGCAYLRNLRSVSAYELAGGEQ